MDVITRPLGEGGAGYNAWMDSYQIEHLSYSQFKSYTDCPRKWYLGKVRQAEEKQTWYLPIGIAVHSMIEDWINPEVHFTGQDVIKASDYLYPLIEKQLEIEPDTSKWLAGGSKDSPIIEEKALRMVSDCFEKALEFLEDIDVWEVEYDASGRLPGLEVPIKAFVDILGEHKKKGPVIIDWKTGSTKPDNFQLETYAALLGAGLKPAGPYHGRYAMLSPAYKSTTRFVDLSATDLREVGLKYQAVYEKMKAKLYQTNAGFDCKYCFQQLNCRVNAGPTDRANYYDRSHDDGVPF